MPPKRRRASTLPQRDKRARKTAGNNNRETVNDEPTSPQPSRFVFDDDGMPKVTWDNLVALSRSPEFKARREARLTAAVEVYKRNLRAHRAYYVEDHTTLTLADIFPATKTTADAVGLTLPNATTSVHAAASSPQDETSITEHFKPTRATTTSVKYQKDTAEPAQQRDEHIPRINSTVETIGIYLEDAFNETRVGNSTSKALADPTHLHTIGSVVVPPSNDTLDGTRTCDISQSLRGTLQPDKDRVKHDLLHDVCSGDDECEGRDGAERGLNLYLWDLRQRLRDTINNQEH